MEKRVDFQIGDLIEEWSDFSNDMDEKPTGIIVDIVVILGEIVYHVDLINYEAEDIFPLYAHEIRKVS